MTLKTIGLSALTAAMITTAATAGTLTFDGTGTNTSYVVASEYYLGTVDVNNSLDLNSTLTYRTGTLPSGTVTEPAITIEFPTGVTAFASTDANITIIGGATIGTLKAASNGTNQLIFDKVTGSSVNSNTDLNITGSLVVQFPNGTTSTTAEVKIGYSTDPSTADQGSTTLISAVDQVTASITTKFNAFIDAANSFRLLVDSTGAAAGTDTAVITFDSDGTGFDRPVLTGGTSFATVLNPDNNVSVAGAMTSTKTAGTATIVAIAQGVDNNYTSGLTAITIDATDEEVTYTYTPTGALSTSQISPTLFTATVTGTYSAGTETLINASSAGSWSIYGYTAQIPNVSGLSTHDTTMKFTNRSTTASEIYFTLVDPDGTTATLSSAADGLTTLGAGVTGTYKASALIALITDTNFDATGSFSVEVSIPTTPNSVYGMASFKNTTLGQFKDLPVYNSSTMSY